ncbi:uncharacterized protein JCM6883_003039 [Sporobolomyces salmoneus]|uniref:uncharacterized protein n=1 Tax=Sporobolomyces salmoneus TaxID=183962 RepID=UPI0031754CDC
MSDSLAEHFSSTLIMSNFLSEHRSRCLPSLTKASLSSLKLSLSSSLSFPPFELPLPCLAATTDLTPSTRRSPRARRRPTDLPSLIIQPSKTSPSPPSRPRIVRRSSWADARSCRFEEDKARRELEAESSESSSSEEEEDNKARIDSFPPRRPPIHPLHRRGRSDPGPATSSSMNKRDLRRTLLKRRATLSQNSSPSRPSAIPTLHEPVPPPRPYRSRRSIESAQALRLKTFNFPSTSTSPFLSLELPPAPPSSISSFSSSNSACSKFSDDSSEEEDTSDSSDSEEDELEVGEDKTNAFDLELDLFPRPPSPPSSP